MAVAAFIALGLAITLQPSAQESKSGNKSNKMTEAQIKNSLSGMKTVSSDLDNTEIVFSERFEPSGQWYGFRSEIALRKFSGIWSIRNGALCVQIESESSVCRDIEFFSKKKIKISDFLKPNKIKFYFYLRSIKAE